MGGIPKGQAPLAGSRVGNPGGVWGDAPTHGLTRENLLGSLPPVLAGAPTLYVLARAVAEVLAKRREEIGRVSIYPRIDRLDGPLLDILARDFKVDWWDPDHTLEEKRRTLAASWQVHKTLGTKAAVEKAASAVYPDTKVQEWFEYGGEPYHFRLDVGLPEGVWDPESKRRLMWGLYYYKNLRSHLDAVEFHLPPVVLENPQQLYFFAMGIYGKFAAAMYPRLYCFSLAFSLKNRLTATASWHIRESLHTGNRARFSQFTVSLHGANNQGVEEILLNGRRLLDGSWVLGQGRSRGLAFQQFTCAWQQEYPQNTSALFFFRVQARSPAQQSTRVCFRASGKAQGRAAQTGTTVRLRASNLQGTKACLVEDTWWALDGTYQLNGAKKLNAGITRSEL